MVSFKRKAAAWSPVEALISGEETERTPKRRGPSLMFAVAVIAGVTFITGAAVATFFSQSAQSAAEPAPQTVSDKQAAPRIGAGKQAAPQIASDEQPASQLPADDKPVMTASLDPAFPPVHKVSIKTFPALKASQLPAPSAVVPSVAVKPDAAAASPMPEPDPAATNESAELVVASAGAVDALEELDPRWAIGEADALQGEFLTVIPPAASSSGKNGSRTDGTETAAIDPDQAKPSRAGVDADDTSAAAPTASGATRSVQVNKGVNMRSRGRSGAGVIMTIPKSATVQVIGCQAWCEVVYKGRRGFIYKSFVGGGGGGSKRSASRAKQPAVAAAPKEDAKTVYVVDSAEKTETPETTGSTTPEKPAAPKVIVQRER